MSSAEAAARLGVKKQTLYAYVSRGLLTRTVGSDGRTSRFDPAEIERLVRDRRPSADGELRTAIASEITRVDDTGLWVRGHDLIQLVAEGAGFIDVVDLLWQSPPTEGWSGIEPFDRDGREPAGVTPAAMASGSPLDTLRIITARQSAYDPLRHDLSPHGVRAAGRSLILAMCRDLGQGGSTPPDTPDDPLAAAPVASLWAALSPEPADGPRLRALDAAMALLADHGLASSTFAARIAASVRADPYSVVSAGLGVIGGTFHGAASASVHQLLSDVGVRGDAATAVGIARRQLGAFPGFGHTIYRVEDPRYGALMNHLVAAWGSDPRLVDVYRVRDVTSRRSDGVPNVDLALGSLTFLARMPPNAGEAIFAIARTAGWLAHAMEEYREQPLRFRARERYIGPSAPGSTRHNPLP